LAGSLTALLTGLVAEWLAFGATIVPVPADPVAAALAELELLEADTD
jgi:hypothetical protein